MSSKKWVGEKVTIKEKLVVDRGRSERQKEGWVTD